MTRLTIGAAWVLTAVSVGACQRQRAPAPPRASGYVEATEVKVAAKVPGRVDRVNAIEGQRVSAGDVLVEIATTDIDLAIQRTRAEREQALAQWRLVQAPTRAEDIKQGEAQLAAAESDRAAAATDLAAAKTDADRFEQLIRARAGAEKQRDDAVARRDQAAARVAGAADRVRAAAAALEKLKAGARPEEIAVAKAHVATVDAQIATLEQTRRDAVVVAPSAGVISTRLVEPGELVAAGAPLVAIIDLDRAWANGYVEEPLVPSLKIDQPATVVTDGGDRLAGRLTFIAPRAEFTPRNVQTTAERAKLVYRVKIAVDNRKGVLKPGMPVEISLPPVVEFAGVGKSFGPTRAVDALSVSIAQGEMFGVIGPDGAGKTTTLRLLCGLLRPDAGSIRVRGADPFRMHRTATASIGYVSQHFSLYGDLSIDENIAFFASIHGVRHLAEGRNRLLELTGLKPFRDRRADRLSGGMKQKLALACTLIHEPPILVLDEPTTGVDPVSRREFWKLLAEFLGQGLTIVMATPYLDEAERCTRVALLTQGRLLALDDPATLQASMQGIIVEVVVSPPRRALQVLRDRLGNERVQLFGDRLHVHLDQDSEAAGLTAALTTAALPPTSVRTIVPTLEDVFIELLARKIA